MWWRMASSRLLRSMELVSTSKTSVLTRAPEDVILHSHRRENLKSYINNVMFTTEYVISKLRSSRGDLQSDGIQRTVRRTCCHFQFLLAVFFFSSFLLALLFDLDVWRACSSENVSWGPLDYTVLHPRRQHSPNTIKSIKEQTPKEGAGSQEELISMKSVNWPVVPKGDLWTYEQRRSRWVENIS
jgi:hypothetical protein